MKRFVYPLLVPTLLAGCGGEETDSAAPAEDPVVRITRLELGAELSQPVYLNHRIPISFDVVGDGSTGGEETGHVAVTFSFVDPTDGDDPDGCSSNAIIVNPPADGSPQTVNAFIWPTTDCAELAGDGRDFLLDAEFYREAPVAGAVDVEMPVIELAQGGIDIAYGLSATSSVALLPIIEPDESPIPALVVQSTMVYNGRDPYVAKVSLDEVPEDMRADLPDLETDLQFGLTDAEIDAIDALPSAATIRYTLSPARDLTDVLPLTIGQAGGGTVDAVTVERVDPGIAMGLAHDLYFEGETLAALRAGGRLGDETAFVLRGCMQADFEQSFGQDEDCKSVDVELARETGESSGATEATFDRRLERTLGNGRIRVSAVMETNNRLSRSGAFSRTEGRVELNGRLGRSFSVTLVGAHAEAELSGDQAAYDAGVVAFNETVYSTSDSGAGGLENEEEFSADRSFRVGSLGFGIGPIRLGFTIDVGGRVGLDLADELTSIVDPAECQALLATEAGMAACGRVSRTVTPNFALTARIFGGLNLRLIRAGVEANLRLVETRFPLTTQLGFGLTDEASFLVRGEVDWDMTLQLINGQVQLVASFGRERRRRRRRRRTLRVNLFSFGSQVQTFDLIHRAMVEPLELL